MLNLALKVENCDQKEMHTIKSWDDCRVQSHCATVVRCLTQSKLGTWILQLLPQQMWIIIRAHGVYQCWWACAGCSFRFLFSANRIDSWCRNPTCLRWFSAQCRDKIKLFPRFFGIRVNWKPETENRVWSQRSYFPSFWNSWMFICRSVCCTKLTGCFHNCTNK